MAEGPVRTAVKPSGDVLQDAIDLFKALAGRDPTPEEVEQTKKKMEEKAAAKK